MNNSDAAQLVDIINEMAALLERNDDPDPQLYSLFFQHPDYAQDIVTLLAGFDDDIVNNNASIYSACVFALDICVAQLQAATEAHSKLAGKALDNLMDHLVKSIKKSTHGLSFWLPVLNAFYEVHADLSQELKDAYFELANQQSSDITDIDQHAHLSSIRDLIQEMSDLTDYEIAENFFAQSYAMPADFFADLLVDLYSIEEGHDIALLALLHPKAEVRAIVVATLDQLMDQVTISPIALSRLQVIKYWYPESWHMHFDRWIKVQRKKGVVFAPESERMKISIKATEVDGTGSQGVFIRLQQGRKNRLCGVLLKYDFGLKDAWVTPFLSSKEVKEYYQQAFEESVTLRTVDLDYFQQVIEHFLATMQEHEDIPHLHFLEIQELLGIRLRPKKWDIEELVQQLSIQIAPFTSEVIEESLHRSRSWVKKKQFTESWFIENSSIDKIVNHCSNFVEGVRVCRLEDAMEAVFVEEMEQSRDKWLFHFLWIALWAKPGARANEKLWQDSFLIAYVIHEGQPLKDIPLLQGICYRTVINSVETMLDRKTHLSKE